MNRLLMKGCNLVNYQTYNNIKTTMLLSSGVIGLSNIAMSFIQSNNSYLGYVSSLFYLTYLYMHYSNGENYTSDVSELRKLYNEFISNYNKINRDFSLDEPIAIYKLFSLLLNNGYLSLDKKFTKNSSVFYNLDGSLGTEVISGSGVCRHISTMLTDILNDYGIPSMNTICYMPDYKYEFFPATCENYSREDNLKVINKYVVSMEEREAVIEKLDFLADNEIYLSMRYVPMTLKDKKLEKYGNHLITYTLHDDKSYYLDPTLEKIYRLKDSKKGILFDDVDRNIFIKLNQLYRMNDFSDKEIKRFITSMKNINDSVSLEMEEEIINSVCNMFVCNMDIFEKFYNDNYELYKEIENSLVKIKKKKR